MYVQLLKSKIHKARITFCDIHYEGSLAIDLDLMDKVGLLPYEKMLVVNATNGARLETYAIPAERGSKTFGLNGAAARLGAVGDMITLMTFAGTPIEDAAKANPKVIVLDQDNEIVSSRNVE